MFFLLWIAVVLLAVPFDTVHAQSCAAMTRLNTLSRQRSEGRRPDGRCYFHVSYMLEDARYGNFAPGNFLQFVPAGFIAEAYQFADWMNRGNNARLAGLQRLSLDDANKAPAGSVVVVRAGTCGTAHPTAGDIAVSAGNGVNFWNGGDMRYCQQFRPGNNFVLGIYVPLQCSSADAGSAAACHTCINNAGGDGCATRCTSCGGDCTSCLSNRGGTACLARCCDGKPAAPPGGSGSGGDSAATQCHTCILNGGGAGCNDQRCTPCGGACSACLTNGGGRGCLERCCDGKAPVSCSANGKSGTCKKTASCEGTSVASSAGAKGCEDLPDDETCCVDSDAGSSTAPFVGDGSLCEDCVVAGGGDRCIRACAGCGSDCATCISSRGGKACADEKCRACTLPDTRYANTHSSAVNVACSRLSESFDGGKWKLGACSRCEYKGALACRALCRVLAPPAAGSTARLSVGQCYDMSARVPNVAPLPDNTPCSADTGTCSAGVCSSQANPCTGASFLGDDMLGVDADGSGSAVMTICGAPAISALLTAIW